MFIPIKARGRSSVGRAPPLQVDNDMRCAFMDFRRWAMSAVPSVGSSASAIECLERPDPSLVDMESRLSAE